MKLKLKPWFVLIYSSWKESLGIKTDPTNNALTLNSVLLSSSTEETHSKQQFSLQSTPSLWDKIPFRIRHEYANRFTIRIDDKISLYAMGSMIPTIYWSDLDRWDYTDPEHPTPPTCSTYTLLSLQNTFIALIVMSVIKYIVIFVVKIWIRL